MKIFLILCFIFGVIGSNAIKVSLFGAGYVAVPLQEAKISTNIRLKFRTLQENCLILLASGRTDYCLIKIVYGEIILVYKIGEAIFELRTPKNFKFNDMSWHDVAVQRYDEILTMQVDDHFIKTNLSKGATKLNIHFGVFTGGTGDITKAHISNLDNFRGCISDVFYNNINILKRAKEKTNHAAGFGVMWNCSTEFEAGITDSVSFLKQDSFVLKKFPPHTELKSLSFDVRSIEKTGILFFSRNEDYFVIYLTDGKLAFRVNNETELLDTSSSRISDGLWHHILFKFKDESLMISVDSVAHYYDLSAISEDKLKQLKIDSNYYFGGLSHAIKMEKIRRSYSLMETSIVGCMKNFAINNVPFGLAEMQVTESVVENCAWKYPCIEKMPCTTESSCAQYGLDEFVCSCSQNFCLRDDYKDPYKIFTRPRNETRLEIFKVTALDILEGGEARINLNNIQLLWEYPSTFLPKIPIIFEVVDPPKHGTVMCLDNESLDYKKCEGFNFHELVSEYIQYKHNGEERFEDKITLKVHIEVEEGIPDEYQGEFKIILHINVNPINDPPRLHSSSEQSLFLISGIPKQITPEMLNASDVDNDSSELSYSVINSNYSSCSTFTVENKVLESFTQEDVNNRRVFYECNIENSSQSAMFFETYIKLSDRDVSETIKFLITVNVLEMRIENNTGLEVVYHESGLLTNWNLSLTINTQHELQNIKYTITEYPKYGEIQIFRENGSCWYPAKSFVGKDILKKHVRFLHKTDLPFEDAFGLKATLYNINGINIPIRIRFIDKIGDEMTIKTHHLNMLGTSEVALQYNELCPQENSSFPTAENVIYFVVTYPKYGKIYKKLENDSRQETFQFLQEDISKGFIVYQAEKIHNIPYSETIDYVKSYPENNGVLERFLIEYFPNEEQSSIHKDLQMKNSIVLQTKEGQNSQLSEREFDVDFRYLKNISFDILNGPNHGQLCSIYHGGLFAEKNIEHFTLENLQSGTVFYCHDGSETTNDTIRILLSLKRGDFNSLQHVSVIRINISPINDNVPYKISTNEINLLRNSTTIRLSTNNLEYFDEDSESRPSDISYTIMKNNFVHFYRFGESTTYFTQDDVNNGEIYFEYAGPDKSIFIDFVVSDGIHDVQGNLKIQIAPPFLEVTVKDILYNAKKEGVPIPLKSDIFKFRTNLIFDVNDVHFEVIEEPSHAYFIRMDIIPYEFGNNATHLMYNKKEENFTLLDLLEDRIFLSRNGSPVLLDKTRIKITIDDVSCVVEVNIRSPVDFSVLQLQRNILYVRKYTCAMLTDILTKFFYNSEILYDNIQYTIKALPKFGYIQLITMSDEDPEEQPRAFTLRDLFSNGTLIYIAGNMDVSTDYIILDITDGITSIRNFVIKIMLVPQVLAISTTMLTVDEGESFTLTSDHLRPSDEYYQLKTISYQIVTTPAHGTLVLDGNRATSFTTKDVENGLLSYRHNSNENTSDSIVLVGQYQELKSKPIQILIKIIPDNDHSPIVVTSRGISVYYGEVQNITRNELVIIDNDNSPDEIFFTVVYASGGFIALKSNPRVQLIKFTQDQVNEGNLVYVHEAHTDKNCKLTFVAADGKFKTEEFDFPIEVKPISLTVKNKRNFPTFPLMRKPITGKELSFHCVEYACPIEYSIVIPPKLGRIILSNSSEVFETTKQITKFSQNDINSGLIYYEHSIPHSQHQQRNYKDINLKQSDYDFFIFDAFAPGHIDSIKDNRFEVNISIFSGDLKSYLHVEETHVDEGYYAPLSVNFENVTRFLSRVSDLSNPEIFITLGQPKHGILDFTLSGRRGDKLYVTDFSESNIIYTHDNSDTVEDDVSMSVFLEHSNELLFKTCIHLRINPVNDEPFYLITSNPQMSLVEKENKIISRKELLTEDTDTLPEDIIYEVVSAPDFGELLKRTKNGTKTEVLYSGSRFSQLDVNLNHILYQHFGTYGSTAFHFKVSDGRFEPIFSIFKIQIVASNLQANKELINKQMLQGSTEALLQLEDFEFHTNFQEDRLHFNVTEEPLHGILFNVENWKAVSSFTYDELKGGKIAYKQIDTRKTNDSLQILMYDIKTNINSNFIMKIKVIPIARLNAFTVSSFKPIKLNFTSTMLSDELKNNSVQIEKLKVRIFDDGKQRFGEFRKIIPIEQQNGTSNQLRAKRASSNKTKHINKSIRTFFGNEVESGLIYYNLIKENYLKYSNENLNDFFTLIVTYNGIHPITEEYVTQIEYLIDLDEDSSNELDSTNSKTDPVQYKLNYIRIAYVFLAFILIVFIVYYIIHVFNKRRRNDLNQQKPPNVSTKDGSSSISDNNLSLMQDQQLSSSVILDQKSTALFGISGIPHCRITQINDCQLSNSDIMSANSAGSKNYNQPCYFYKENENIDEDEYKEATNDLNNCIVAPNINPLLRRNQYWV